MTEQQAQSVVESMAAITRHFQQAAAIVQGIDDAGRAKLGRPQGAMALRCCEVWLESLRRLASAAEDAHGAANACIHTLRHVLRENGQEA